MAYDKIIPVTRRLDHCAGYILNPEKTTLPDGRVLADAINCKLETACQDMADTKRRWGKRGGVLGYHVIHSYVPGEVTPSEAHEIGMEFARRLFGERYEAIVSTHIDQEHLHCHILFNSVSFVDGAKYHNTFKDYFGDIRGVSNEVSAAHGLSVIEPEGSGQHYAEWDAEKRGKATVRGLIRQDIDIAIASAFTYKSFWAALERMGYEVKHGKHTALKPPGSVRFVRLVSLGERYTEEHIKARLSEARTEAPPAEMPPPQPKRYTVQRKTGQHRPRKLRGFRALYIHYLYVLGKRPARKRPVPFSVRQEVTKLHRYQRQFRFLQEYHIDTTGQLAMLGDALQAEIDAQTGQRKDLYRQQRQGADVSEELESINASLRELRRKLKLCKQIAEDVPKVRGQIETVRAAQEEQQKSQTQKKEVTKHGRKR